MIYIAHKKSKLDNLKLKYPNAHIMDLTSKAREPYIKFSPFYPHGRIPVPFSSGTFAESVEGIWQGLKVFENEGIDQSRFFIKNMKGLKRTIRVKGKILGHQKGVDGIELMKYLDARLDIYLPTYKYVLDEYLVEYVEKLTTASKTKDLVFLDYETNCLVGKNKPLSHAFLVKAYLEGNYPTRDNYSMLDEAISLIEKPKKSTQAVKSKTKVTDKTQQIKLF